MSISTVVGHPRAVLGGILSSICRPKLHVAVLHGLYFELAGLLSKNIKLKLKVVAVSYWVYITQIKREAENYFLFALTTQAVKVETEQSTSMYGILCGHHE